MSVSFIIDNHFSMLFVMIYNKYLYLFIYVSDSPIHKVGIITNEDSSFSFFTLYLTPTPVLKKSKLKCPNKVFSFIKKHSHVYTNGVIEKHEKT